ncbi:apolipoprotein L6 [Monodelphis domestica]|uniref:apolipoprotein L6 n=1 Tax=Monodelphis domestica TaxID=13616 RepID=UPI0024E208E5|nr:apolipoprotein L6 [Monodelphis domestica]
MIRGVLSPEARSEEASPEDGSREDSSVPALKPKEPEERRNPILREDRHLTPSTERRPSTEMAPPSTHHQGVRRAAPRGGAAHQHQKEGDSSSLAPSPRAPAFVPSRKNIISFTLNSLREARQERKVMETLLDTITPKFWKSKQVKNSCLPLAIPEDPLDSKSMNELKQSQLSEDEAWERFFADSSSMREKATQLSETLYGLFGDTKGQDGNLSDEDKIFLKEFPKKKMELEERIQDLHAIADQVDKTHKKCIITNVVAGSTSIISSIVTIMGLALAPVTAGGSLILSASGFGLGALAAITSLSSSVIERVGNLTAKERVSNHKGTKGQVAMVVLCKEAPQVVSVAQRCVSLGNQVLEEINKNIRAFRLAKANTCLTTSAKTLMTTGSLSTRSARKVEKAFGGTALAMTKGSRMMSAMTTGAFVLVDMITVIHDLNHLLEGAKAEMAGELREQAQELEGKLEELSQAYHSLLDIVISNSDGEGKAVDGGTGPTQ